MSCRSLNKGSELVFGYRKVAFRKVIMWREGGHVMRTKAVLLALLMATVSLSGCFGEEEVVSEPTPVIEEEPRIFVTDKTGASVGIPPIDMTFQFSDVGETGKEPSIGITSSGCIFFIAMEKVMRSCDGGQSWEETQDPVQLSLIHISEHTRPY